jgi:hypothetical protein
LAALSRCFGSEKTRCVGKISRPGSWVETRHDGHLRAGREPFLLAERDRSLVAVMAVCNQELLVVEVADDHRVVDPPELRSFDLEVRLPLGPLDRGRSVVQQEDRLQLDARCPQEAESLLLRTCVCPFVRQHRSGRVGLDLERGDEPEALAGDAVRADVVLFERPDGRRLLDEDAVRVPVLQVACRLLLGVGESEVDDVVRAPCPQLCALLVRDHVVRRRDQVLERPRHRLVVAKGAEGLDDGHRASLPTP